MEAWLDIEVAICTSYWIYINLDHYRLLKSGKYNVMDLKVCLLDECVSGMHSDQESSYVTDQMPLQTLEYKVSLFW
jgi:hypothetical protein